MTSISYKESFWHYIQEVSKPKRKFRFEILQSGNKYLWINRISVTQGQNPINKYNGLDES